MPFASEITELAEGHLRAIRVYDRRRIVDEIKSQLPHQPHVETRNRKCLEAAVPAFEHRPPIWELRVGDYRVFYDVDEVGQTVYVRAVRQKGPGRTTEDIIHETEDT
jgi:mRNA-degrading endonuclease RelE of RelBE toxin-antitoxin system